MGLPDLRDILSCIGGDPSKRTGIVVAKSIPAKIRNPDRRTYGYGFSNVRILWPFHLTFELYDKCSRAQNLWVLCTGNESFSIDEVFWI